MLKKRFLWVVAATLSFGGALPAHAWNDFGHMAVAYIAYQRLTPEAKQRANTLVALNPKFSEWSKWVPAHASPADKARMVFMIAATWPDQIKNDPNYISDGTHDGNRPDGSPDASANRGYSDLLRHKYWHFVDTPFSTDGTSLPPIPVPNAQERIALFRGVLGSGSGDLLKSYDLVWLLHLAGDVHQPLHCAARISSGDPDGDDGGNGVKIKCFGCPAALHGYWDGLLGNGQAGSILQAVRKAAEKLPPPDPALVLKRNEKDWIAESFQAARSSVYQPPIGAGHGPFKLSRAYKKNARKLAERRIALAGARLADLLNHELN